jgi:cleavage and polyadenylation specificity factor subunit 2
MVDFSLFDERDVGDVLSRVVQLQFQATHGLAGSPGVRATPFAAGYLVGGAFWRLETREGEHVVYAVDFNHGRERLLDAAAVEVVCVRPSLLITDGRNARVRHQKRRLTDQALIGSVVATLRAGGNVLMPTDWCVEVFFFFFFFFFFGFF